MTEYVIRDGRRIEIETAEPIVKPATRRAKRTKPFAQVSLELAARMAQAVGSPRAFVLVMLTHLAWQAKGQPFPFTNGVLKKYGVSRDVKREVLAALEAEGLIKVERCHTRSPVVTVTNHAVGD
jgi:hypothetical protein